MSRRLQKRLTFIRNGIRIPYLGCGRRRAMKEVTCNPGAAAEATPKQEPGRCPRLEIGKGTSSTFPQSNMSEQKSVVKRSEL